MVSFNYHDINNIQIHDKISNKHKNYMVINTL